MNDAYYVERPLSGASRADMHECWADVADRSAFRADHGFGPDSRADILAQVAGAFGLYHWTVTGRHLMRRTARHVAQSDPDHLILTVPLRGHAAGAVDDITYAAPASGNGLLITPDATRTLINESTDASGFTLVLDRGAMAHRLALPDHAPINATVPMGKGLGSVVRSMAGGLLRARHDLTAADFETACDAMADLIAMVIVNDDRPDAAEHVDITVQAIRQYVRNHLHELSLPKCARDLGWSQRRIQAALELTGTTWRQAVQEERLERARGMLRRYPSMSITSIAHACGYQSEKWFSAAHHARHGESPRDYRNRVSGTPGR